MLGAAACGGSGSKASSETTAATPSASVSSSSVDAATTTSAAKQAAPKPCELVTKDEAETLAGTPLDDPVPAQGSCTFTGPTSGPVAQVEVFVGDGAKKYLDIDRDTLGHKFEAVPGIGDEALIEDSNIFVRKGTTWAALRLTLLNDAAENRPRLEALAATVAGRL
jgi:hypothetical protein